MSTTTGNNLDFVGKLLMVLLPKYLTADSDDIGTFLDGNPIGIGHPHGEVFHIYIGQIELFEPLKDSPGFHEIGARVLGVSKTRAHSHQTDYLYVWQG